MDFVVADLTLAEAGRHQISLAEKEMPGLMALREEFGASKPLTGARIAGSLHMTVQTAVLIETLVHLGAQVRWASCNIFSTQDEAAAAVVVGGGSIERPAGVPVFAFKGETIPQYWEFTDQILRWESGGPNLILDDGGDATILVHAGVAAEKTGQLPPALDPLDDGYTPDEAALRQILQQSLATDPQRFTRMVADLLGSTEETTTGVMRLDQMHRRGELLFPAINVNDAVTKSKFDNRYGIRHSMIDGLNRATDVLIGGKIAFVCGYGDVGKGAAEALRGQGARVIVSEVDPICALQAAMDGFEVARLTDYVDRADFFITTTGNRDIITLDHMRAMKDKAIVANVGHFDNEIAVADLAASEAKRIPVKPQVDEWQFSEDKSIILLSEGRLMNLGNATGHPSFVMSASFTNQVLGQLELFVNRQAYPIGVHRLPKLMDEKVARLHLDALGVRLTELTETQADYIGVPRTGPFKPDHYRY